MGVYYWVGPSSQPSVLDIPANGGFLPHNQNAFFRIEMLSDGIRWGYNCETDKAYKRWFTASFNSKSNLNGDSLQFMATVHPGGW
jgi:hypothetical protein